MANVRVSIVGKPGSGKTAIAEAIFYRLRDIGIDAHIIGEPDGLRSLPDVAKCLEFTKPKVIIETKNVGVAGVTHVSSE